MNGSDGSAAVRYLQTLMEAGAVVGLSDGQLLERFIAHREEAALEVLVQRHGPMVWGVCRRVLRDHHDAEDAFQATFLVLARRAASVEPREKVGNWLYGVAYQTAMKARATRARRQMREGPAANVPEPEARAYVPQDELAEWLDHELRRLPDKYRTPIVLCELEGKTHGEAAEQLGWPVGTVSGRLSRARAMLAKRLTRRGVTALGGALAALLARNQTTAAAGVPAALLSSTTKSASLFAAGGAAATGAVSADVAALTGEVLKAMRRSVLMSRIKFTAAALLLFALAGTGVWQARTRADGKAPAGGSYRLTVAEILRDDDVVMIQVDVEAPAGARIEILSNEGKDVARSFTSDAPQPNGVWRLRVNVLADHAQAKDGATNVVKFRLGYQVGKITSSESDTVPMPAGAKVLADVVTVPIQSGEHKYGQATKLVTFNGVNYRLVVTGLK